MEYLWIANDPKDFLQLVRNEVRMLPGQSTRISESGSVIFDAHDPALKNTKGIPLPELAKVNEINLKPISVTSGSNWFSAALCWLSDWILLHASRAGLTLAVMLDKSLCNIPVFFFAIPPSPLLTHVTIFSVPLINAMKCLFSGHNNPANSAVLPLSEYCARRVGSRNNNLLKDILLGILGTIVVGFSNLEILSLSGQGSIFLILVPTCQFLRT